MGTEYRATGDVVKGLFNPSNAHTSRSLLLKPTYRYGMPTGADITVEFADGAKYVGGFRDGKPNGARGCWGTRCVPQRWEAEQQRRCLRARRAWALR